MRWSGEAAAVIADLQVHRRGFDREANRARRCSRVAGHVRQRLLRDAIRRNLHRSFERRERIRCVDHQPRSGRTDSRDQPFERGEQPKLSSVGGRSP